MNTYLKQRQFKVVIGPGEYLATRESIVISTLLGSCIAVCLYDPVNQIAGMNHFLLATQGNHIKGDVTSPAAARYGNFAMQLLIKAMLSKGAVQQHLQAKVFGGGDVLRHHRNCREDFYRIGEDNCRFALNYLENAGIPLMASDFGGDCGRNIHLRAVDFAVFVRKISSQSELLVARTAHDDWKKHLYCRPDGIRSA